MKQITTALALLLLGPGSLFVEQAGICLVCYFVGMVVSVELSGEIIKQFIGEVKDEKENT